MQDREKPCKLCCGITLVLIGILGAIWTPACLILKERLAMIPGLPSFDEWKDPPQTILAKIHVFNITNRERFLSGEDAKIKVEDVGPIVYRERWIHKDIVFNDNDTITYTVTHMAVFAPELNHIDLNATITVANIPLLGVLSYFADAPFYTKLPLSYFMKAMYSTTLIETTLYEYLHNWSNPIVGVLNKLAPSIFSVNNLGVMEFLYRNNFTDRVTVFFGERHGHDKFMLMDKYDGSRSVPHQGDACKVTMLNATEGLMFTPYVTKDTVFRYFRKVICTVIPIHYESETEALGFKAYKYSLRSDCFNRTSPIEDDCSKGRPVLPDGIMDISKCYYNFPVAVSFPHFLYGHPKIHSYVDGLQPNESLHKSYTIVEPTTGVPLESAGRSQVNLVINPLSQVDEAFNKFSDTLIPMFWIEYLHVGLPVYLLNILYVIVNVVPVAGWIFVAAMVVLGTLLTCDYIRKRKKLCVLRKPEEKVAEKYELNNKCGNGNVCS